MKEILSVFTKRGVLLTPEAAEMIMASEDPLSSSRAVVDYMEKNGVREFFIKPDVVEKALAEHGLLVPLSEPEPEDKSASTQPEEGRGMQPGGTPYCDEAGEGLSEITETTVGGGGRDEKTVFVGEKGVGADDVDTADTQVDTNSTEPDRGVGGNTGSGRPPVIDPLDGFDIPPDLSDGFEARRLTPEIEVLMDVTDRIESSGSVEYFRKYFSDRYKKLRALVRKHQGYSGNTSVVDVERMQPGDEIRVVAIIKDIKVTDRGTRIVELEDEFGTAKAIIPSNSPLTSLPLVNDEVIGVSITRSPGRGSLIIKEVVFPDIPARKQEADDRKPDRRVYVAFVSDVHVGSDTFLPGAWARFVGFLRGVGVKNGKKEIAENLKYLVVSGDLVDGIGVYPNQEKELVIHDIESQYRALAKIFRRVPDHVEVLMLPGNHDMVRQAEPQPAFSDPIKEIFVEEGLNIHFLSNPTLVSIEGVKILAYHGRSMDDFLGLVPGLSYENPIEAMKIMLQKRHLAPVYGGKTPIAPEPVDHLVIETIPDIFVTGHVHSVGVDRYRGVLLVNSSTWQSQTSFQKMHNFNPIPARVPVVNLQTLEHEILDFSR